MSGHTARTRRFVFATSALCLAGSCSGDRVVIGARYPIQQAAEAHRALASGATYGKVLLPLDA